MSNLSWRRKFSIFAKRKSEKRKRKHIMKINAQGMLLNYFFKTFLALKGGGQFFTTVSILTNPEAEVKKYES